MEQKGDVYLFVCVCACACVFVCKETKEIEQTSIF